jgi:hypothetical protein
MKDTLALYGKSLAKNANSFTLQSYIGPLVKKVKSKELTEGGFATKVEIVQCKLNYLDMEKREELLLDTSLPFDLWNINPRTILGQKWWDIERKKAYARSDYKCMACGRGKEDRLSQHHPYLDGHELYTRDYYYFTFRLKEIVALCHDCHAYIHIGSTGVKVSKGIITKDYRDNLVKERDSLLKDKLGIEDKSKHCSPEHLEQIDRKEKAGGVELPLWFLVIGNKKYNRIFPDGIPLDGKWYDYKDYDFEDFRLDKLKPMNN